MAMSATPAILSKPSQLGIINFQKQCYTMLNTSWNIRENMRRIDLAYIRENDLTKENQRAKYANRYGDADKLQNITIPVVMPQVEAAVVYQSSVFLTGIPLFGVVADPDFEDEAMQLESVIDANAIRGGWVRQLMMHFRNGFKYNFAALEVVWDREVTAGLDSDPQNPQKSVQKNINWEGNKVKNLDPYNVFFDARVAPTEMHKDGEFAGYTERMSRSKLKTFINRLPDKMVDNIKEAFESGIGDGGIAGGPESFYIPDLNPNTNLLRDVRATTNWLAWASLDVTNSHNKPIEYKNLYEVTTMYARIIPSDFGIRVPSPNTPQVWKFIIVNHKVLIYAERQTNAHEFLPIILSQPLEDGLSYQTKSLAYNVLPFQEVSSSLMNSVIAARRRAISDRGIFDPSRITEAHINSANPSAKIPVRPSAYGKNVQEAYFPIPFRDDQSPLMMQQIKSLGSLADQTSGHNQAQQGQFVKGNKTQHEYEDVMDHANGRDQMVSMLLEDQLFQPLKLILKSNTLQYQGGTSVFNRANSEQVDIDPTKLRAAELQFKISDGLTPTDKLISEDTMMVAMQQIGTSPQIAAGFNITPLFTYLMKTQNVQLAPFEKSPQQVAYEQAAQQWQQVCEQIAAKNPAATSNNFPPQPTPQQFGYTPGQSPTAQQSATQQQPPTIPGSSFAPAVPGPLTPSVQSQQ